MAFTFAVSATFGSGLEKLQVLLAERAAETADVLLDIAGAGTGAVLVTTLGSLKFNRSLVKGGEKLYRQGGAKLYH